MQKRIAEIALGFLIVVIGLGFFGEAAKAAPTVMVTLAVSPTTYNDFCPVQITYRVSFRVNEACTIQYHIANAKGEKSQSFSKRCDGRGTFLDVRTLPTAVPYSGWVAVQVTAPVSVQSNQVSLSIKCKPKATITAASLKYGATSIPDVILTGLGFGETQGTKNIQVDGVLISAMPGWSVLTWSNTSISVKTAGVTPWEHTYQIAITEGTSVVSNVFAARFLYKLLGVSPTKGTEGSKVHIGAWNLPETQGSYLLKMGSHTMPVLTWATDGITARVPVGIGAGGAGLCLYSTPSQKVTDSNIWFLVLGPPLIRGVGWYDCSIHSHTWSFGIWGNDFGDAQGTKKVKIDSLPGWTVSSWKDYTVELVGPNNIVPWTQTYAISFGDGGETISNTFEARFSYFLVNEGGTDVPANSTVRISAFGLPATQGAMTVKFNQTPVVISTWQSPYIEFRAPNLPGTSGWLTLWDGGTLVSLETPPWKLNIK